MAKGIVIGGLNSSGGGSNFKSIQRGDAQLNGVSSKVVTIANVDLTKSIIILDIVSHGALDYSASVKGVLTNPTTLTLSRATATGVANLTWTVIEFNNVKSLQSGLATLSANGLNTVAIASVDVNKSLAFNSCDSNNSSTASNLDTTCNLTNSTTLAITQGGTHIRNQAWYVVEFN